MGLFDGMHAFWKHMSSEHHHAVVAMIDRFYREAEEDERYGASLGGTKTS